MAREVKEEVKVMEEVEAAAAGEVVVERVAAAT